MAYLYPEIDDDEEWWYFNFFCGGRNYALSKEEERQMKVEHEFWKNVFSSSPEVTDFDSSMNG